MSLFIPQKWRHKQDPMLFLHNVIITSAILGKWSKCRFDDGTVKEVERVLVDTFILACL